MGRRALRDSGIVSFRAAAALLPMHLLPTERLDAVFRAVSDGIVLQDPSGAIVAWNPAAERLLGLTGDQLMGRASLDSRWRAIRLDGSDLPGAEHPAMVTMATGEPLRDFIMGIQLPDGSRRWLSVNTDAVDEGGQRVGVVAAFTDISRHLEAQARARHVERVINDIREIQAGVIGGEAPDRTWARFLEMLLGACGGRVALLAEVGPELDDPTPRPCAALVRDAETGTSRRLPLAGGVVRASGLLLDAIRTRLTTQGSETLLAPFGMVERAGLVAAIPLTAGGAVQGVLLLADCPGLRPAEVARTLELQLVTGGQLLAAARAERQHRDALRARRIESEARSGPGATPETYSTRADSQAST